MSTAIIGIDCATEDKNVGLALGFLHKGDCKVHLEKVKPGNVNGSVAEKVTRWINYYSPALLALDTPLGWPKQLGEVLINHQAGDLIDKEADDIFMRETDKVVQRIINHKPIEVGANIIARTAHSALVRLACLRKETGQDIPLAWKPGLISDTCAIEVYPAGTLRAYLGKEYKNYARYKHKDEEGGREARNNVITFLKEHMMISPKIVTDLLSNVESPHKIDAAICVLAGADFLRGKVHKSKDEDLELAKKEGWIWVYKSRDTGT